MVERRDRPGAAAGDGLVPSQALPPHLRVRLSERRELPPQRRVRVVWEYLDYRGASSLACRAARRAFSPATGAGVLLTCEGADGGFYFKDAGRVFQVEVYLGPEAAPALRARAAAALDSLPVAPAA